MGISDATSFTHFARGMASRRFLAALLALLAAQANFTETGGTQKEGGRTAAAPEWSEISSERARARSAHSGGSRAGGLSLRPLCRRRGDARQRRGRVTRHKRLVM
jgi:hypothetical protein